MNGSMSSNEACAHENMIHDQKEEKKSIVSNTLYQFDFVYK